MLALFAILALLAPFFTFNLINDINMAGREISKMRYDSIRGRNPKDALREKINELIDVINSQQKEIEELKSKLKDDN